MPDQLRKRSEHILGGLSDSQLRLIGRKVREELLAEQKSLKEKLKEIELARQKVALQVREEGDGLSADELDKLAHLLSQLERQEEELKLAEKRLPERLKKYERYKRGRPQPTFKLTRSY